MQASLFDAAAPDFDPDLRGRERARLAGGAWVDYLPNWLAGHDRVYAALVQEADWAHHRRRMYERTVDVPRLTAAAPARGATAGLLRSMGEALSRAYGIGLPHVSLAWYRDGRDSVAPHGDKLGRLARDTVVAIVSVGAPRRFVLRPAAGGTSRVYALGWGDLLVMGGTCQRTWQHGVPKAARADPRISIQYRPCVPE